MRAGAAAAFSEWITGAAAAMLRRMDVTYTLEAAVSFWDVDREQKLSLPGVFKLLQEAAIKHADRFDVGAQAMQTRGETWMLYRMAAAIHRYPDYGDRLTVCTWSSGIRGFKGYRDFRVHCGGELIASASSLWLYYSLRQRALARVPPEVTEQFPVDHSAAYQPALEKLDLAAPETGAHRTEITLRYSDVDANQHVNNATYLDFLQTAIARAGRPTRPTEIAIQFQREIPAATAAIAVELGGNTTGAIPFAIRGPDHVHAIGRFA